jgi:glutamate synthase (ferredoxin)
LQSESDITLIQEMIYQHLERTESEQARAILADWSNFQSKFWKVSPILTVPKPGPAAALEQTPVAKD